MVYLFYLADLVFLVCWVMVLIKMFQTSVLQGILGIITCGIWAIIWGWLNAEKKKIKQLVLIMTIAYIVTWVVGLQTGNIKFTVNA